MPAGPGQAKASRVGTEVEHHCDLRWRQPVVGDQLEDFALARAECGQAGFEEGSLSGGVDGRRHGVLLGRREHEVGVGRFHQQAPGSRPAPALFGEDPASDSEKPRQGRVGLRHVPTRRLEGDQEGLGYQVGDVIGIRAAPDSVQRHR